MSNLKTTLYENVTRSQAIFIAKTNALYAIYSRLYNEGYYKNSIEQLSQPCFKPSSIDVSYRTLNHWDKEGLLAQHRDKGSVGWRKFSFVDLVWIELLNELRAIGIPLNKLINTHDSIYESGKTSSSLYFACYVCLQEEPKDVFVAMFDDGRAEIVLREDLALRDFFSDGLDTSIRVSLNKIVDKIAPSEHLKQNKHKNVKGYVRLLETLKDANNSEVKIKLEDGRITHVEAIQHIKNPKNTAPVIDMKFGEISYQVVDGKPTFGKKTTKEKY